MSPAGFDALMFLDPSLCDGDRLTDLWVAHSWRIFTTLSRPNFLLPFLCVLAIAPWVVRPFRRLRWASRVSWLILTGYLLVNTSVFINLGNRSLVQFLPDDTGEPVDAIVVLGRGGELRPQRVEAALNLWRRDRAPLIFASGRGDGKEIVEALEQQGIPQSAVNGESCSRTTEENAQYTASLLKPQGVQKILLITDPPHMLRSLLTFRSFGFRVIPHPSAIPPSVDDGRLRFLLVREWIGLFGYGLRGRYFPRTG
jgi:uncharacterized SAM-binding protein YcdF (DUF218 family)